jgi:type IV pilus assembly protein PilM
MPFGKRRITVGLDVGSSLVKVVEIERTPKATVLCNYGTIELLPDAIVEGELMDRDSVVESIRTLLASRNIQARSVVSAVSGRGVIVKKVLMERLKVQDARERIPWEAEQHIPFDLSEVTLDFQIMTPQATADQMEVLLVAVKNDIINSYVEVLTGAGLNASILDVGFFAIQNAYEANYDYPDAEIVALVNIGADTTNINLVKGGIPVFTRDLILAGNACTQALQKDLGITFEKARSLTRGEEDKQLNQVAVQSAFRSFNTDLANEVGRTFTFLESTGETAKVSQLVLSGGGTFIPGLQEALAQRFALPVSVLNPLQRIQYDPVLFTEGTPERLAPLLAMAIGLGMRET